MTNSTEQSFMTTEIWTSSASLGSDAATEEQFSFCEQEESPPMSAYSTDELAAFTFSPSTLLGIDMSPFVEHPRQRTQTNQTNRKKSTSKLTRPANFSQKHQSEKQQARVLVAAIAAKSKQRSLTKRLASVARRLASLAGSAKRTIKSAPSSSFTLQLTSRLVAVNERHPKKNFAIKASAKMMPGLISSNGDRLY